MLNVAIVGLGRWGRRLVDAVQDGGRPKGSALRFTRAVARTPATARDYCMHQALRLGDYPEVLADPAVDAVVLATPHGQHGEQIVAAAAASKHVFVEKPFTLTRASAANAIDACAKAGVVLAVGHNRRFLPAIQRLNAMIEQGDLGSLLHVEGNFSGAFGFGYKPGMWRVEEGGGTTAGLTAMGIHMIDAFIHLCGPIAAVSAEGLRRVLPIAMDDTTSAMFRFANGMSGYLATMTATAPLWRLQAFGTKAWAHMRDLETIDWRHADGSMETLTFPKCDIERAELEAFAAAAAGARPYPISPDDALHGVAVMEAVAGAIARGYGSVPVDLRPIAA